MAHSLIRRDLPVRKKLLFAISTCAVILAALELILWTCGVRPAYYRRDPFAGFTPQVPHFKVETNAGGEAWVTVVPNKCDALNDQAFPLYKQPDTYRIV
jgi:hypothetical protein